MISGLRMSFMRPLLSSISNKSSFPKPKVREQWLTTQTFSSCVLTFLSCTDCMRVLGPVTVTCFLPLLISQFHFKRKRKESELHMILYVGVTKSSISPLFEIMETFGKMTKDRKPHQCLSLSSMLKSWLIGPCCKLSHTLCVAKWAGRLLYNTSFSVKICTLSICCFWFLFS